MSQFERIVISQLIRDTAISLGIPIVSIFREARVDHTNMNKWEKPGKHKASPTRRTENKILDAIERLSKRHKENKQKSSASLSVTTQ